MGNRTVAENSAKGSLNATLQEVLDLLETEDGKSFDEKKEEAIKLLRRAEDSPLADTLIDLALAEKDAAKVKTMFWASGNIFSSDETVTLRRVAPSDRGDFLDIQREYSVMKSMLKEEVYCANSLPRPFRLYLYCNFPRIKRDVIYTAIAYI